MAEEMLLAGSFLIARQSKADVACICPLRMHAKIVLQGSEYGVGLIDAERAADRQIPQARIGQLDLDVRVPADIGETFR
jgi:hypothetical protein